MLTCAVGVVMITLSALVAMEVVKNSSPSVTKSFTISNDTKAWVAPGPRVTVCGWQVKSSISVEAEAEFS